MRRWIDAVGVACVRLPNGWNPTARSELLWTTLMAKAHTAAILAHSIPHFTHDHLHTPRTATCTGTATPCFALHQPWPSQPSAVGGDGACRVWRRWRRRRLCCAGDGGGVAGVHDACVGGQGAGAAGVRGVGVEGGERGRREARVCVHGVCESKTRSENKQASSRRASKQTSHEPAARAQNRRPNQKRRTQQPTITPIDSNHTETNESET